MLLLSSETILSLAQLHQVFLTKLHVFHTFLPWLLFPVLPVSLTGTARSRSPPSPPSASLRPPPLGSPAVCHLQSGAGTERSRVLHHSVTRVPGRCLSHQTLLNTVAPTPSVPRFQIPPQTSPQRCEARVGRLGTAVASLPCHLFTAVTGRAQRLCASRFQKWKLAHGGQETVGGPGRCNFPQHVLTNPRPVPRLLVSSTF